MRRNHLSILVVLIVLPLKALALQINEYAHIAHFPYFNSDSVIISVDYALYISPDESNSSDSIDVVFPKLATSNGIVLTKSPEPASAYDSIHPIDSTMDAAEVKSEIADHEVASELKFRIRKAQGVS
jgi:hypothetical protein